MTDACDAGAGLPHVPGSRKRKAAQQQDGREAMRQTAPAHALPAWLAAVQTGNCEEGHAGQQSDVDGALQHTDVLVLAHARIEDLESELAETKAELAAARAQLADRETQLTAMSTLVNERARRAAP